MKREKKIGFSYALYESKKNVINENGEEVFPLYMKVIYDKKSTRFPYPEEIGKNRYTKKEFEDGIVSGYDGNGEFLFKDIIRFESNLVGENYKIKGVADRLPLYTILVMHVLSEKLSMEILLTLGDYFTYNFFDAVTQRVKNFSDGMGLTSDYYRIEEEIRFECRVRSENDPSYRNAYPEKRPLETNYKIELYSILTDNLKKKIASYLAFISYLKMQNLFTIFVIEWLKPESKLKSDFKKHLENGLNQKINIKDERFSKLYKLFKPTIDSLEPSDIFYIIDMNISNSYEVRKINKNIESMKKGK